jgi:hypothetical protein
MSSETTKEKEDRKGGLSDLLKDISPNFSFTDYLKRFFYQIIGIYFPPTILFLYIFLFWYVGPDKDPINYYSGSYGLTWPDFVDDNLKILEQNIGNNNQIIQVILFLVAIVILGEGINGITSRLTMLTPIIRRRRDVVKFSIMNRPFPGISMDAKWPIWLNETSFPVSFSQFDRYYVSALEEDKRTLAGKIGWVSFYRNMVAVFAIILILQVILLIIPKEKAYGYEMYVLIIGTIALVFMLFGYWAQVKSNKATLWDAYKRYELRKNLEIRYGDLTLSFGIKDKYKKRALEYIIDRWFLAVDTTIQTISRWFLTKLEQEYVKLQQKAQSKTDKISKIEKKIRNKLTDSYSDWNRGAYERVIANSLDSFKKIKRFQKTETSEDILTEDEWKIILGFYILENSLRTDSAFLEITTNLSRWGWTIQNDKEEGENKVHSDNNNDNKSKTAAFKEKKVKSNIGGEIHDYYTADPANTKKDIFDQTANLIRETSDEYQKAFFKIIDTLKNFNKLLSEDKLQDAQKSECFGKLTEIYRLFGGYQYKDAFDKANEFFKGIYQEGSLRLILKSDNAFYRPSYIGYITKQVPPIPQITKQVPPILETTKQVPPIPEDAIITEIINPSSFRINSLSHIDENGKKEEFCSRPYLPLKIDEEKKVYVVGEWNVESLDSNHYPLPQEISIELKWKAPINNPIEKAE